jgi:hypothetical protein
MSKCGLGWPALVVMTVGCGGKGKTFNIQRSTLNFQLSTTGSAGVVWASDAALLQKSKINIRQSSFRFPTGISSEIGSTSR